MRAEDILEFLRRRPFAPIRIHVTDGRTYDVRHPDQIIVLRSRIIIAASGESTIPEHVEHLAPIHVVRVEEFTFADRGAGIIPRRRLRREGEDWRFA